MVFFKKLQFSREKKESIWRNHFHNGTAMEKNRI